MITVKIIPNSGLGNVLFQYAYGRNLAARNHTSLSLDFSYCYNLFEYREVKAARHLKYFNLNASLKIPPPFVRLSVRFTDKFIGGNRAVQPMRHLTSFSPDLLEFKDGATVCNYYQSEKYFSGIESTLRADLAIRLPAYPERYQQYLAQIRDSESVAVHIRRTDSLNSKVLVVCGREFFVHAIDRMKVELRDPRFFIFSDDLAWAEQNLPHENTVFVNLPEEATIPVYDLSLIAACKHQIMPNSTFSWWGAWLNEYPQKVVIAPDTWRKDPFENEIFMRDILPPTWIALPVGNTR